MKISELKPKTGSINIEFEIIEKGEIREFNKFGKSGRVCNAVAQDNSGKVKLTHWNEDVDKVNVGDKVKLTEGYVGEYQGELQLSTGRGGKLEITGKADGKSLPAAEKKGPSEKPSGNNVKTPRELEDDNSDDDSDEDSDSDDVDEEFVE
jgi:replication factor A1